MQESRKILLDTNFLLIPEQLKIDIFEELQRICYFPFQVYILDKTLEELQSIKQRTQGKDKTAANVALELIKVKNIQTIDTSSYSEDNYVDSIIQQLKDDYIVATQDIALRKHFKRYIILRQKKYLELKER